MTRRHVPSGWLAACDLNGCPAAGQKCPGDRDAAVHAVACPRCAPRPVGKPLEHLVAPRHQDMALRAETIRQVTTPSSDGEIAAVTLPIVRFFAPLAPVPPESEFARQCFSRAEFVDCDSIGQRRDTGGRDTEGRDTERLKTENSVGDVPPFGVRAGGGVGWSGRAETWMPVKAPGRVPCGGAKRQPG
jgi:hypothetical protein